MANNQNSKQTAQAKKNKTVFFLRVVGIVDQLRALIREDGPCFFKADAMLLLVRCCLSMIPLKVKLAHAESVPTV